MEWAKFGCIDSFPYHGSGIDSIYHSSELISEIGEGCQEDSDCGMANAFCHRKLDGGAVCTCDIAYTPSTDRLRCLATYRGLLSATSLGHACHAHLECQLADPNSICNAGVCDCASGNATTCGSNNTGCYKHTFQVKVFMNGLENSLSPQKKIIPCS